MILLIASIIISVFFFVMFLNKLIQGINLKSKGDKFNKRAIKYNGGRMPVFKPMKIINTETHFSFGHPLDVNEFNLCDIYKKHWVENGKIVGIKYYSFGDTLIQKGRKVHNISIVYYVLFSISILIFLNFLM